MTPEATVIDSQNVLCEVCGKAVPKPHALMAETREGVAYFCGEACYAKWHAEPASEAPPPEIQEGRDRSTSRDEQLKRLIKQHPLRDEPRADSVEPDELPPS